MKKKTKQTPKKNGGSRAQEIVAMSQANLNALALGYDFEHRAIYLFGPIDKMAAYRFIAGFKWIDRTPGPIHILLNSEGGDTDAGMALYECLRTANNPTVIEGMGIIASAAVPVLLAGTVRFLNPETKVMIHNVSYDIDGSVGTPVIHSLSKEADAINKRYTEIVAERTGKSFADVSKWLQEETYFTCSEAIKHGFADKILDQRAFPKNYNDAMEEVNGKAPQILKSQEPIPEKPKKKKRKARK